MATHEEQDAVPFSETWAATMRQLRVGFKMHGFDVSVFSDDQVRGAIVAAAMAGTDSSRDFFTRAFEMLIGK